MNRIYWTGKTGESLISVVLPKRLPDPVQGFALHGAPDEILFDYRDVTQSDNGEIIVGEDGIVFRDRSHGEPTRFLSFEELRKLDKREGR